MFHTILHASAKWGTAGAFGDQQKIAQHSINYSQACWGRMWEGMASGAIPHVLNMAGLLVAKRLGGVLGTNVGGAAAVAVAVGAHGGVVGALAGVAVAVAKAVGSLGGVLGANAAGELLVGCFGGVVGASAGAEMVVGCLGGAVGESVGAEVLVGCFGGVVGASAGAGGFAFGAELLEDDGSVVGVGVETAAESWLEICDASTPTVLVAAPGRRLASGSAWTYVTSINARRLSFYFHVGPANSTGPIWNCF